LLQAKHDAPARTWHEKALATYDRMAASDLVQHSDRSNLGHTLQNLGLLQSRAKETDAAQATTRRAVEVFRALLADYPDVPQTRAALASSLTNLASFMPDSVAALPLFAEAIAHHEAVVAAYPDHPRFRDSLVKTCRSHLLALARSKRHREIAAHASRYAQIDGESIDLARTAAQYLAFAVRYADDDADLEPGSRQALIDSYVDALVLHVREMLRRGGDREALGKSYFDPVRERPKFVQLLDELAKR
jgi:tetratricopeptide (TPR) repeat protein